MIRRRRRQPDLRAILLLMAAATAAYVAALALYALLQLQPAATALGSGATLLAEQFDSLRSRTLALDSAIIDMRRLAVVGSGSSAARQRADSWQTFLTRIARESAEVRAAMLLSKTPVAMRIALAEAAHHDSDLAATLLEALQDARSADQAGALRWLARADTVRELLAARLNEAQRLGLVDMAARERQLATRAARLVRAIAVWIILGVLLTVLAFMLMRSRLWTPLQQLSEGLAHVARGDLDASLTVTRDDELGRLQALFNQMTAVLRTRPEVEALRASEIRFRSLIEHATDIISIIGPDDRIKYASPAVRLWLGYDPDELVGQDSLTLPHPDDLPHVRERLAGALRGEHTEDRLEWRIRHKDGSWRQLESILSNMLAEPTIGGVVVHSRDVTERARALLELERSRESFARIFRAAPVCVALSTLAEGRFVDVNEEFLTVSGYAREEMVGRTSTELDLFPDPDTRAALVHAITATGLASDYELRIRTRAGAIREVRGAFQHMQLDGQDLVLGTFTDVTERRLAEQALAESEQRFRVAFMTGSDAYEIDERDSGLILTVNDQFEALYGYGHDEVIGRTSLELGLWAVPEAREELLRALTAEGAVRNWPVVARRKNGETFPVLYSVRLLPSAEPALMLGVIRDMSEQQRAEDALRSMEEQFRQAQRLEAIGRLAGGVAHDFNNVLTAISGFSDILLEKLDPSDACVEDVQEIRNASARATNLTRQLLAFSHKQVLRPRVIDVSSVIVSLQKMLPRLLGDDVTVHIVLPHEPGAIYADPGQIEQVVVNFAVNSRDAMPAGGELTIATGNVDISAERARAHPGAAAGEYVMLSMTDTGTGMDAGTQAHIFEPFFTTKEPGKGTGLGLSTVHGIVAQSGGFITVHSEVGRGTTFEVYFPRAQATAAAGIEPPLAGAPGGSESILIAEDDPAIRRIMTRVLTKNGYRTQAAADGASALELARGSQEPVRLLISDIMMPGMSGYQLAEQFRREHPTARVLFVSGYTGDETALLNLRTDVNYLQKPFTPAGLARKVREVLDAPLAGDSSPA